MMTGRTSSGPEQKFAALKPMDYLFDIAVVVVAMVVIKQSLLPHTLSFAGPVSLVAAVVLASWRLWRRGEQWRDLGLGRPQKLGRTFLLGLAVMVGIVLSVAVSAPIATELLGISKNENLGLGRFGDLQGNWSLFLMWFVLSWVHAGFNEELIYRVFLISRLERVFKSLDPKLRIGLAVLLAAAFFGYRHMYYQGWYGFITTGTIGLFMGIYYVRYGRVNMWPLVIGHGLLDSTIMTLQFIGLEG